MNGPKKEQLLTLGIGLAMTLAFYFVVVQPKTRNLRQIRNQGIDLAQKNEQINLAATNVEPLNVELNALRQELAGARIRLPEENHTTQFERTLFALGEKHRLINPNGQDSQYLKYLEQIPQDDITTQNLKVQFVCNASTIFEFLADLEKQEKLSEIRHLHITKQGPDQFQVTLELSIYYGKL